MGRKLLLWLLGYAGIVLLIGVGLLGFGAYSAYKAGHGAGMPEAQDLTSASGSLVNGREITVERKRRRGGRSTERFYELDFQPAAGGELVKLRADIALPVDKLKSSMGDQVSVKYDGGDHNIIYEMSSPRGPHVEWAEMARILQVKADRDKESFTSGGMLGFAALLAVLGGLGLAWRRKLQAETPSQ